MRHTPRLFLFITFALNFHTQPLHAETPPNIQFGKEDAQKAIELPKPGEVNPGKAPTAPTRSESSAAAMGMAASAAGMQNMACSMMMKEAQKAEGKDKAMMQMMAMQQCAQAAQTMANAMENKKNKEKAEKGDPGTPPTMKLGEFKAPEAAKDIGTVTNDSSRNLASAEPELPEPLKVEKIEIPSFEKQKADVAAAAVPTPAVAVPRALLETGSIPNTIARSKIGYDETGKAGTTSPGAALGAALSSAVAKPGADAASGKKETFAENVIFADRRGRKARADSEGGDSGGSSGGSAAEGGSDTGSSLEAMMAILNGAAGGEPAASENGQEILALGGGGSDPSKPAPNIFEYATYRYKKAAFDEGRIKPRPLNQPPVPPPSVLAVQATAKP